MNPSSKPLWARVAVALMFFVAGITFSSWAARIPQIQQRLQLSEGMLGTVLFALPVGAMLSLPLSGWLAARVGSRLLVFVSSLLAGLLLLLPGWAPSVWHLALGLFLLGFNNNTLNISINTQAVAIERQYARPIMSSFHALYSFGGMVGAAFGGLMAQWEWPPLQHFALVAGCTVLLALAGYRFLLPPSGEAHEQGPLFAAPTAGLWWLGLIAFCCMMCEGAMADWSSVYLAQAMPQAKGFATAGYTAFSLAMASGRFLGDALTARWGMTALLRFSGLLAGCGLALALWLQQWAVVVVGGFALVGLGCATVVPLVYSAAGHSKAMAPSVALAAVSTVGFTGFLIGPPMIGWLAEGIGLRMALALVVLLCWCIVPMAAKADKA